MQKFILSVTVQNNAGVLARVSSLFGRRGYNIDSLTVSATNDPRVSRMSIIVQGDEVILEQTNSGNYLANGKGVHRELESERSRRQTSDLTYRNFIQGI